MLNLSAFEIRFPELRPVLPGGRGPLHVRRPLRGAVLHAPHRTLTAASDARVRSGLHEPSPAPPSSRAGSPTARSSASWTRSRSACRAALGRPSNRRRITSSARALREFDAGREQFGFMLTDVRRNLDSASARSLRSSATTALAQGYARFWHDAWKLSGYGAATHVEGSANAIALTQLGSVHYYQRPDGDQRFDSTRTTSTAKRSASSSRRSPAGCDRTATCTGPGLGSRPTTPDSSRS